MWDIDAFATPVLQKPAALGADIVMHSGTKYLDGQGRVMAGALCGSQALITEKFAPVVRTRSCTVNSSILTGRALSATCSPERTRA